MNRQIKEKRTKRAIAGNGITNTLFVLFGKIGIRFNSNAMEAFFDTMYAKYDFVFLEIEEFEKSVTTNGKKSALFFDMVRYDQNKGTLSGAIYGKKKEGESSGRILIQKGDNVTNKEKGGLKSNQ